MSHTGMPEAEGQRPCGDPTNNIRVHSWLGWGSDNKFVEQETRTSSGGPEQELYFDLDSEQRKLIC